MSTSLISATTHGNLDCVGIPDYVERAAKVAELKEPELTTISTTTSGKTEPVSDLPQTSLLAYLFLALSC